MNGGMKSFYAHDRIHRHRFKEYLAATIWVRSTTTSRRQDAVKSYRQRGDEGRAGLRENRGRIAWSLGRSDGKECFGVFS